MGSRGYKVVVNGILLDILRGDTSAFILRPSA